MGMPSLGASAAPEEAVLMMRTVPGGEDSAVETRTGSRWWVNTKGPNTEWRDQKQHLEWSRHTDH